MFMKDFSRATTMISRIETVPARVSTGLVAGTLVETAQGWQPIETLRIGDCVQTFDGGLTRVLGLDQRRLHPEIETTLFMVPGGSHDACSNLFLLSGQHVLIDTLHDASVQGAPFVLVPAAALVGINGVYRHHAAADVSIITPMFAEEEVIYANSGVLLHCPSLLDGAGHFPENSFFSRLDVTSGRSFMARRAALLAA